MDAASILNRKWTLPVAPPAILDIVQPQFAAYINSNAFVSGIDPETLNIPLPAKSVVHALPAEMIVRDQSVNRLTCVAHASMAAMEVRNGVPKDLSEQYAHHWFLKHLKQPTNCCDDAGVFVLDAANALTLVGIPEESDFPYTSDRPSCSGRSGYPCIGDAHDAVLPNFQSRYRVTSIGEIPEGTYGATIGNVGYLEAIIEAGYDIVYEFGIAWIDDKHPEANNPDNIIDVILLRDHNNDPLPAAGYHAVLLTGYNRERRFFIARNSMGDQWGTHRGDAWLSYKYVTTYGIAGYVIKNVVYETGAAPPSDAKLPLRTH